METNVIFHKSKQYNEQYAKLDRITECDNGDKIIARVTTRDRYVDYTISSMHGPGVDAAAVHFHSFVEDSETFNWDEYERSEILIEVEHFRNPHVSIVCSKHEYYIIIIDDPFDREKQWNTVHYETNELPV